MPDRPAPGPRPSSIPRATTSRFSGVIYGSLYNGNTSIGFTKQGTGELLLSNAVNNYTGLTNIAQGTVRVNSVATAPGQSYSALGSGNINVRDGGTLHIDNVAIGVDQNQTLNNLVGWVDLYSGATLKGSGNASYERGSISPVLNFSGGSYSPGSVTFATVNSGDVLAIKDTVRQYDPNYLVNEYGNWDPGTRQADPTKLITAHVAGPGVVKLQDGGVSAYTVFGGQWSVDSGTLQVGPFVANTAPDPSSTSMSSGGPYGEPLNALGFHTPNGQGYPGTQADPDLPNAVTVNAGGTLAIAVDQVNGNPNVTGQPVNATPSYLRNPVTLSGGSVAATGYEVKFGANPTDPQGVPDTSKLVTARLGGDFTVAPGTSKVLTYDPVGGTGARTVELVGGTRYLANASIGWAAGSTINYATNWQGTLTVDPGTTTGGAFNIRRTAASGPVTVTPGAALNILAGATVNILGANVDSKGEYVSTGGTYHMARNNVLKDDGSANAVAVSNAGQFNVSSGVQTAGTITGSGTTSVTTDANDPGTVLNTPQITQSVINVGAGATLHLTDTARNFSTATSALNLAGGTGAWTGSLDVDRTGITVMGASDATIRNQLIEGRNGGSWNGPGGILSAAAHGDSTHLGVGYIDVAGGVKIGETYLGDADLNGSVGISDLNTVFNNFGKSGMSWSQGDFDYNGGVGISDLNVVFNNFAKTSSSLTLDASQLDFGTQDAATIATFEAVAHSYGINIVNAVPEPSSIVMLASLAVLGGAWRVNRRRQRCAG